MNFELFRKRLEELVVECGGLAEENFRVEYCASQRQQGFHPRNPLGPFLDPNDLRAERSVTPVKIEFTVFAAQAGRWHHVNGDDKRLHSDLQEANAVTEYMSRKGGALKDRRFAELQPNGEYVMRDPVTDKAYDISTGSRILGV